MHSDQLLLFFYWLTWCIVHSVLALPSVKLGIENFMGKYYRFYRLTYTLFAFITLGWLVWFHFNLPTELLWQKKLIRYIFAIPLGFFGLVIMAICIKKYFYELSGIQALDKPVAEEKFTLQQQGLHKLVRHPLYLGTLMLVWGIFFYFPTVNNLIACAVMSVYVMIGIRLEEVKLVAEFGEEYINYRKKVPMLIPFT